MTTKEATILAYCIDFVLNNGDHSVIEAQLTDLACIKDLEYLKRKYEAIIKDANEL
jgi:hypothetical protein